MPRPILILAALAAAVCAGGCTSVLRGPDTCEEIHFDSTYVLARWAGWSPREAGVIAAANLWTDRHGATNSVGTEWRILGGLVNPLTLPWVLGSGLGDFVLEGEGPARAFGRRAAESTAWAAPPLGHRLHFPSTGLHAPVSPAFFVNPRSGEIEYGNPEARRVLERAFLDLQSHDDDPDVTLALLGIGLHTLQDSFKHSGFNAAQGHIGARSNPDHACGNLDAALLSAEVTLNSLRYARRLFAGRSSVPPKAWKQTLRRVYQEDLVSGEGWRELVRAQFQDDYPVRSDALERWQSAGGEAVFERALERVKDALE